MPSWCSKEMADKGLEPWSPPTKAEASGTREKKALFSSRYKHERLCHSMWLFHLHSMVKIQPLSLVFPLRNSWLKYFVSYSFGTSRKKVSTIFYDTATWNSHIPWQGQIITTRTAGDHFSDASYPQQAETHKEKRREKLPAFFALAASQKMADAFSLKSQRDKQQNVLAVDSANGKAG